nr:hypothetical protein [Nitrosomonas sp.]
ICFGLFRDSPINNDDSIEHYEVSGNLSAITDHNSRTLTLIDDGNGRMVSVNPDTDHKLSFTSDGSIHINTITIK